MEALRREHILRHGTADGWEVRRQDPDLYVAGRIVFRRVQRGDDDAVFLRLAADGEVGEMPRIQQNRQMGVDRFPPVTCRARSAGLQIQRRQLEQQTKTSKTRSVETQFHRHPPASA